MRVFLRNLLACCLLFCLMLAPARAEMPSSPEERYAQELSLLNRYLQNSEEQSGLDIAAIRDIFLSNGNIGEHAMAFMAYADVLARIEGEDFAGARATVENLQSSASFAGFRAYLEDGEDLRNRGLYAIRPLNELEAYMLARECEAQGRYTEAIGHYDQCQTFFDSYIRRSQAIRIAPTPNLAPTPSPIPTPSPSPEPTPSSSNTLASRFVERFPDLDAIRENTREIRFLSTLQYAPADAIDVSQERDGSVLAWFDSWSEKDTLYIGANGVIYAPEDSRELFAFGIYIYGGCEYAPSLQLIDFGDCFDTGRAVDMAGMFSDCSNLKELDVSGFDTGNVTNMSHMFSDCSSLAKLDVSGFDTSNVTDMSLMFENCSSLTKLGVRNFDTSNVTNMSYMFAYCAILRDLDVSNFDTGNVTDMSSMFSHCLSLTELDVTGFDTGNVANMEFMFGGCSRLTELDTSGFDMRYVVYTDNMFYDCPAGQNVAASAGSERPRLGITISTIDGPSTATPGAAPAGVRIEAIEEHGPAGNAGLRLYDVITEIAGERVCTNDQALEIIGRHSPGDFIELSVCRHFDANGELTGEYQEFTVEVRLEAFD